VAQSVDVAGRRIGPGAPCFVIAEAGVNHNGDLRLAHQLVDAAAAAKADAVKFQTFDPALLVTRKAPKADYQARNTGRDESQYEMLRRLVLSHKGHEELRRHAQKVGLIFLSTAFDEESADFLDRLGVPAFKVPSGELTNHPFLTHLAGKGRPLLISTGMGTLEEVRAALETVRAASDVSAALLHCVSTYPALPADCNLRAIETMHRTFNVPVGWSDHTVHISVATAAVAVGAAILEKHLTLDRNLPGPDHQASLEPVELTEVVRVVREIEAALGDGVKRPTPAEAEVAHHARRGLHVTQDLAAGHVLTKTDIAALRPSAELSPGDAPRVLGRRLRRAVSAGEPLSESDLA
jgi:N,N'-diacetyllegionaminate synthase